ncbi:MAG TPA: signal peptide peptidase SppA [Steroidobacteraceae bacterium]|jgi:protease-4|nr:signal peptide peptidase SppA [Steroidobacteraceae bacterium]
MRLGAVGAIFLAIGRGLDWLRKFLHLLLLLLIFGFIVGALRVSIPTVPSKAALLIAPEGEIVDQLSGDPIERAITQARGQGRSETLVWDLVDAIRGAAKDKRIPVIVIDTENFAGAGQPTLEELARALKEFRATGKKVIAYGTELEEAQYYLASQADEVYVDPFGMVLIDGYESYHMFYKNALDKLGVDINVFRVGAYKSAVEVYSRTDMSPEAREEATVYLNSLWSTYQKATTAARKLKPDALANYVATLADSVAGPPADAGSGGRASAAVERRSPLRPADVALKAGLVTGIKSRQDLDKEVIAMVGEDRDSGGFKSVSVEDYVRVVHAEKKVGAAGTPKIGVVVAAGEILDGDQPPGTIGGSSTARLIREARMDDDVKAVVLRIDSPGGSVTGAEEIYREILALKAAGKPLIVSMGDLAASGGYYIAAPADEIWASPATITGSIGIFAVIPTVGKTLGKVGVTVDGVGTTPLSGQMRLDRPLGDDAKKFLQAMVERGYDEFITRVSSGRKKTPEQVNEIAQGRVWSGNDALRLGLVDHLGSFDDAVKAAAKRAKLTSYDLRFIEPSLSWAQELALQVRTMAIKTLFTLDDHTKRLMQVADRLDPLAQEVDRLSRMSAPNHLYAYCFCGVR